MATGQANFSVERIFFGRMIKGEGGGGEEFSCEIVSSLAAFLINSGDECSAIRSAAPNEPNPRAPSPAGTPHRGSSQAAGHI